MSSNSLRWISVIRGFFNGSKAPRSLLLNVQLGFGAFPASASGFPLTIAQNSRCCSSHRWVCSVL